MDAQYDCLLNDSIILTPSQHLISRVLTTLADIEDIIHKDNVHICRGIGQLSIVSPVIMPSLSTSSIGYFTTRQTNADLLR